MRAGGDGKTGQQRTILPDGVQYSVQAARRRADKGGCTDSRHAVRKKAAVLACMVAAMQSCGDAEEGSG